MISMPERISTPSCFGFPVLSLSLSLGLLPSCCFIVTTIGNPFDLAFMRCKNFFRFALQWKDGKENEAQWRALMKERGRKYGDESVECFWNSIARHWTAFVRYIIYYRRNDEQFLDFFSWPNKNISLAKTTPRCNCDYFRCNKSQKMLSKVVKTSFSSFGTFLASFWFHHFFSHVSLLTFTSGKHIANLKQPIFLCKAKNEIERQRKKWNGRVCCIYFIVDVTSE